MDEDEDESSSQKVGQNIGQTLEKVVQTKRVNGFQDNREDGPSKRNQWNNSSEFLGQTIADMVTN